MVIKLLEKLLQLFNIPKTAVRYFRLSNKLSGLSKNNFPIELVPLNTKQLSRGMLNYTFFQHYPDWKRPFWAVKQYDSFDSSFIPRSHIGVSVNVTHRNWTAIGNMECDVEPIVDPCGSVVPFIDGWSIECWIKYKGEIIIPAYCKNIKQKLLDDFPVVETEVIEKDFCVKMIHYTLFEELVCEYEIKHLIPQVDLKLEPDLELIIAVRPFNFEGVSPIESLFYNENQNSLIINKTHIIYFDKTPENVILSNLEKGDCANLLSKSSNHDKSNISKCEFGFANALAIFKINNIIDENKKISLHINLNNKQVAQTSTSSIESVKNYWNNILIKASSFNLPDEKLCSLVKSSLISCLQFIDKETVTPGPAIYHQFWFRDAAFQLNILDKLGFTDVAKNIINTFFSYQNNDGYFQSQKGEWDSNGQVLWLILQHALLSNDQSILKENFSALYKAVKWIDKNRLKEKKYSSEKYFGLLPTGLSAEHLGLADHYYWDNFWAIAGIKSFILICELLGETNPRHFAKNLLDDYEKALVESIAESINSNQYSILPSAPSKTLDSGMIGSLIAVYPLQILDWQSKIFVDSLDYVYRNYFKKNLFFQDIIHSGGNPYITLQIAHSFLLLGNRNLFNKIFNDVIEYSSPTLNFPEAIHPLTGGGVIGDGHHGWAAAEVLSSTRDAFVYERNFYSLEKIELVLLSGIVKEFFESKNELSVENVNLLCGSISLKSKMINNQIDFEVKYDSNGFYKEENLLVVLPFIVKSISSSKKELSISFDENETTVFYKASSMRIIFNI